MDEQICPRCRTSRYKNPSLKLLVNECGHPLCENCIEIKFIRGTAPCDECGVALRKTNFRECIFGDSFVEKEISIRRRLKTTFNKREDDFTSLRKYNDYLEFVETMVMNLAYDVDTELTKERIKLFKAENKEIIQKNNASRDPDLIELEELIDEDSAQADKRKQELMEEEIEAKMQQNENKRNLLNNFLYSEQPADKILESYGKECQAQKEIATMKEIANAKKKKSQFSSGIRLGKSEDRMPISIMDEGEVYIYTPVKFSIDGPTPPNTPQLTSYGYTNYQPLISDEMQAGGFLPEYCLKRSLQEAFCGLFYGIKQIN